MRILHLLKTSVGGQWALRQMGELVKLGVEVHAVLPPDGPLIPEYEAAGITVHSLDPGLPMRAPSRWPGLFSRLRRLVADVCPDLIHSHFVSTTLTMRLAMGRSDRTPRIFQVPGPLHLEHAAFRVAEIATAGPSDYWIGSCRWTCDRFRASGIAADRVFLSYYGCNLESFTPRRPGRLRGELGLTPDRKIVGMVSFMYAPKWYLGQSRGLKGHEDLIDAISLIQERKPDLVGVFVGGAWGNAASYEARVRAYGARCCGSGAVFLGTRQDVPELYADMDVAVHPSRSENVGGAVESLLLGIPTVATGVGGLPDVVIDGETGWLVPPGRPDRLAGAVLTALQEPSRSREMASRGRELASQLLDVRQNAREVVEIYQAILSRVKSYISNYG